ncbi:MAG: aldehyde dehydrogenase family protein, partial [Jatrophihabitantaceae bacterium]
MSARANNRQTQPATSTFSYAPAPESRDIARLKPSYQIFVDGGFRDGAGDAIKTINPADESPLAEVAEAGTSDVDDAVKAARRASDTWAKLPGKERGKYLFRIARAIQERGRELSVLESLDNGKPIRESRDVDIPTAAAHFFYYAGWADKLGHAGFGPDPKPVGVAGQVIPWNFPLLMAAWKIAPALACGNTVVLKPAETTPLTALVLAEIIAEAGLPNGVVNVLAGGPSIGQAIVEHDGLDKIAFTGSTEVGKIIQRTLAGTGRRVSLELGGKAANIVFDDAPIDQAVE